MLTFAAAGILMLTLIWWPDKNAQTEKEFLDDFGGLEAESVINDLPSAGVNSQKTSETGISSVRTNLKTGEIIPFRKTIEQQVSQDRLDGTYRSTTHVEIEMNLKVCELLPDESIHWSVEFTSVKYRREQPEGVLEYDSTVSTSNDPPEAALYAGLTHSGFHFRQNTRDGSFEIDSLDVFLKHVFRYLPSARASLLRKNYRNRPSEKLIALFVDDSFRQARLLIDKKMGETLEWTKDDFDPVPFQQRTEFKVTAKQNRKTVVDIRGIVIPVSDRSTRQQRQLQCSVIGGHAEGSFLVDDSSGLPEKKQLRREISMKVSSPNRRRFFQQTQISQMGFERLPRKIQIAKTR